MQKSLIGSICTYLMSGDTGFQALAPINGYFKYENDFKQGKSEGFESCDRPIVWKRPIWVKIGDV